MALLTCCASSLHVHFWSFSTVFEFSPEQFLLIYCPKNEHFWDSISTFGLYVVFLLLFRHIRLTHLRDRFRSATATARITPGTHAPRVSATTIRRRLKEHQLSSRRPYVGAVLTRRHRRARVQWAQNHLRWPRANWRSVLFSDETKVRLFRADGRDRCWRRGGERYAECCIQEVDRFGGGGLMVWGGISYHTKTPLHIFRGRVTAVAYRDEVLRPIVVPTIQNDPRLQRFQQDNARAHTARVSATYLQQQNINVLPWPALSPDMSPIEHVWDTLKRRVKRRRVQPQTLQQLEQALLQEWRNIPQRDIQTMINSMRKRCGACIAANGGHTRY